MSASLVGSEMCIRDRDGSGQCFCPRAPRPAAWPNSRIGVAFWSPCSCTVSYTHLTLPTICSV
eukprot:7562441-Alexandrium_andersonii.AAC.1